MKAMTLATLALFLAGISPAQAKLSFYPTRFAEKSEALKLLQNSPVAAGKLNYYGGPVISNANVVAVMWGNNVVADIKAGVADFYKALVASDLMTWMDQYNTSGKSLDGRDGTNQHIGKGTFSRQVTINPAKTSGNIDDAEIQAEIEKQVAAGVLPPYDSNTLYMIYFPPGMRITIEGMSSCSEFCAYHNAKGTPQSEHYFYGVMPDLGGSCSFGCGFGQHFNNVTSISTHEFCEAVTDPFPTPGSNPAYPQAWNDNSGSEVGDLCSSTNTLRTAGGKSYQVQAEFDNSTGACTNRTWSAP